MKLTNKIILILFFWSVFIAPSQSDEEKGVYIIKCEVIGNCSIGGAILSFPKNQNMLRYTSFETGAFFKDIKDVAPDVFYIQTNFTPFVSNFSKNLVFGINPGYLMNYGLLDKKGSEEIKTFGFFSLEGSAQYGIFRLGLKGYKDVLLLRLVIGL